MDAMRVDQQAEGRVALTPGAEGAEECILYPDQRGGGAGGGGLTPPCCGGAAPDHHAFARAGQAGAQVVAGGGKDAADAGVEETAIQETQPPGNFPGGAVVGHGHDRVSSPRPRWPASLRRWRCR